MLLKNGGIIIDIPEREISSYIRAGYHVVKTTNKKTKKGEVPVEEVVVAEDTKAPPNNEWKKPYKKKEGK